MTPAERADLPSLTEKIVHLETVQGDKLMAKLLFVFDEGETPDLFCVEVERGQEGTWIEKPEAGYSILLADVASVKVEPNQ
ncbi:hypothetical protein [Edaphobacter albus]|uniref:hypothetical protein n=1 Tax=Edaphobacter sp. 4G125 TaxID=2763071 RepID=UPI001647A2DB|nr:hypothetical protein [Edaphobacter sp. 4G125]QNI37568.1 hypothetical protein H7846_04500 [Edaphobacter sp. 4G125]